MFSTIHLIVLILGLLFGLEAFAISMSFGETLASAALQASGWWGAFSASHFLAYLAIRRRSPSPTDDDTRDPSPEGADTAD